MSRFKKKSYILSHALKVESRAPDVMVGATCLSVDVHVQYCVKLKKVKCAILLLEFRRGAHLPS